jgi:tetratricopeptide (TPR) repeat protein
MDNSRLEQLLNYYGSNQANAFIIFAIAKEYEKRQDWEKALHYYLELRDKHSDYVGLYYHLAKLYEEFGHADKALNTYLDGIKVAEQQSDLHALSELKNAKMNLELEEGL